MSKAFTSEENEDEGLGESPALPPGVVNYMTRKGADRFQKELEVLEKERQSLSPAEVTGQNRLRTVERRMRFLSDRLETAKVIDPMTQAAEQALFGATVTLRDAAGKDQEWRIVGIDEADLDRGWSSWLS